jgi:hypothetical protein
MVVLDYIALLYNALALLMSILSNYCTFISKTFDLLIIFIFQSINALLRLLNVSRLNSEKCSF